jgi:hypothetical protein
MPGGVGSQAGRQETVLQCSGCRLQAGDSRRLGGTGMLGAHIVDPVSRAVKQDSTSALSSSVISLLRSCLVQTFPLSASQHKYAEAMMNRGVHTLEHPLSCQKETLNS